MRVGRRISVAALNANINADLNLGAAHGLTGSWVELIDGGVPPYQYIAPTADNTSISIFGGRVGIPGSGAYMIFVGNAGAPTPGDFYFVVPNAALNADITAMVLHGNLALPYLDMQSHRIAGLLDPVAAQDALTLKAWANYAPTWTWTANPAAPTIIARWVRVGNVVHYMLSYHSTDSNAGVLSNVTLPAAASASAAITPATVLFQNRNTYIPSVGFGYQAPGGSDLAIKLCPVTVDAEVIDVYIFGCMEVS